MSLVSYQKGFTSGERRNTHRYNKVENYHAIRQGYSKKLYPIPGTIKIKFKMIRHNTPNHILEGSSTVNNVKTEFKGSERDCYLDARSQYAYLTGGLYPDTVITMEYRIKYYQDYTKQKGRARSLRQIDNEIPYTSLSNSSVKRERETKIRSMEKKQMKKTKALTPISRKPSKRKQYENPYNVKSKYAKQK